ncbi:helix-turn-helix domain-containing protein [Serratia ficaria]|uniref:helix-turn-helix domain-containing protein n=1 Tax=Serratia ficaria TaxID=61651 RepID=UPI00217BDCC4|nr:helix-turn-helix domain-containing protein [Serratia ficaria]CAI0792570.1 DNA-binding transcriptional regulator Nlp [Serratia ficaria]CAI1222089.1 DNA-binding transcriptional regulator Nlp [Serratia ficaria]CAI1957317.1 DNA-binding transcriptional regulator Nlp [Serratia ficaria]CAI2408260.1 DNA-binding transcriptional regulator Nlp [Serratia ficaria]CAI2426428.1 DNA-binding transcriptional regulator Nlp [Serratia ficaria]
MSQNEDLNVDWHPETIKAEIHKRGLSFRALSLRAGYSKDSLKSVLRTPCKPYQQIVADALGVQPETIWPSRYTTISYINKAL